MGSTQFFRKLGVVYFMMYMGVSENSGTPKSSMLIGFSIINHPFLETPIWVLYTQNGGKIGDPKNLNDLRCHKNSVALWPLGTYGIPQKPSFQVAYGGFKKNGQLRKHEKRLQKDVKIRF